jgi:hypothetical protein
MLAPNLWLYGILGALVVGAIGGSYLKGRSDGKAIIIAQQARDDQIRMETLQLAQLAAAEEIAKITVTHTTIRQKAEVITREKVQYRDCVNDPLVSSMLDAARANQPEVGGELPGTSTGPARNFW